MDVNLGGRTIIVGPLNRLGILGLESVDPSSPWSSSYGPTHRHPLYSGAFTFPECAVS